MTDTVLIKRKILQQYADDFQTHLVEHYGMNALNETINASWLNNKNLFKLAGTFIEEGNLILYNNASLQSTFIIVNDKRNSRKWQILSKYFNVYSGSNVYQYLIDDIDESEVEQYVNSNGEASVITSVVDNTALSITDNQQYLIMAGAFLLLLILIK